MEEAQLFWLQYVIVDMITSVVKDDILVGGDDGDTVVTGVETIVFELTEELVSTVASLN